MKYALEWYELFLALLAAGVVGFIFGSLIGGGAFDEH